MSSKNTLAYLSGVSVKKKFYNIDKWLHDKTPNISFKIRWQERQWKGEIERGRGRLERKQEMEQIVASVEYGSETNVS
jgi:hypothetical protein